MLLAVLVPAWRGHSKREKVVRLTRRLFDGPVGRREVVGDGGETEETAATVAGDRDNSATLYAALIEKIEQLLTAMERHSLAELIELFRRPRRMLFLSFTSGVARGFGIAVGFTIIGAIFLYFLGRIAALNLPVIGEFVAEIARIVQGELAGP